MGGVERKNGETEIGSRQKEHGKMRNQIRQTSQTESNKSNKSNESNKSHVSKESAQTPNTKPQTSSPINKEVKKELQKQQRIFQQLEEQIGKLIRTESCTGSIVDRSCMYSDKNKFLEAEARIKISARELENLNHAVRKNFELIVSLEAGANG